LSSVVACLKTIDVDRAFATLNSGPVASSAKNGNVTSFFAQKMGCEKNGNEGTAKEKEDCQIN